MRVAEEQEAQTADEDSAPGRTKRNSVAQRMARAITEQMTQHGLLHVDDGDRMVEEIAATVAHFYPDAAKGPAPGPGEVWDSLSEHFPLHDYALGSLEEDEGEDLPMPVFEAVAKEAVAPRVGESPAAVPAGPEQAGAAARAEQRQGRARRPDFAEP